MRAPTVVLLTVSLLAAGAGPAVAQEASPSPSVAVQRIEVPEAGIALTVPSAWEVSTPLQSAPANTLVVLMAYRVGDGYCALTLQHPDDQVVAEPAGHLQNYLPVYLAPFRLDPTVEVSDEATDVTLGSRPAVRVDMVEHVPEGDIHIALYALAADRTLAFLDCGGFTRPDDDWLSIAETIEFLPDEE